MNLNPFGTNSHTQRSGQTTLFGANNIHQFQDENALSHTRLKRTSNLGQHAGRNGFPRKALQPAGNENKNSIFGFEKHSKNSSNPSKKQRRALGDISNQNSQANILASAQSKKGFGDRKFPVQKKPKSSFLIFEQDKLHQSLVPKTKSKEKTRNVNRAKENFVPEPECPAGRLWDADRAWAERLAAVEEDTFPIEPIYQVDCKELHEKEEQEREEKLQADIERMCKEDKNKWLTSILFDEEFTDSSQKAISDDEFAKILPAINNFDSDIDDILLSQESNAATQDDGNSQYSSKKRKEIPNDKQSNVKNNLKAEPNSQKVSLSINIDFSKS